MKTKKLIIELSTTDVDTLKEQVRKAKEDGVYMTQPIYLQNLISEHLKSIR